MVKCSAGVSGASEPRHSRGAGSGRPGPAPREVPVFLCVAHRYHNCFSLALSAISLSSLGRLVETIFFFLYLSGFWELFLHFALAEIFALDIISTSTVQVTCDVSYI